MYTIITDFLTRDLRFLQSVTLALLTISRGYVIAFNIGVLEQTSASENITTDDNELFQMIY